MKKILVIVSILALTACQPTAHKSSSKINEVEFRQEFDKCTQKGFAIGSQAHKKCTIDAYLARN